MYTQRHGRSVSGDSGLIVGTFDERRPGCLLGRNEAEVSQAVADDSNPQYELSFVHGHLLAPPCKQSANRGEESTWAL